MIKVNLSVLYKILCFLIYQSILLSILLKNKSRKKNRIDTYLKLNEFTCIIFLYIKLKCGLNESSMVNCKTIK